MRLGICQNLLASSKENENFWTESFVLSTVRLNFPARERNFSGSSTSVFSSCAPQEIPCLGLDVNEADLRTVPGSEARPLPPGSCKISFRLTLRASGVGGFSHQASRANTSKNQALFCRITARWGFVVTTSPPRTCPPPREFVSETPSLPYGCSGLCGVLSEHMEKDADPAFLIPGLVSLSAFNGKKLVSRWLPVVALCPPGQQVPGAVMDVPYLAFPTEL